MVKLVVADDEEKVCRLIIALGDWERLGIEVVGTAANGLEAAELVAREKADILITDIRMPGLNGLELIEKIKKISSEIKIMIISGYANFEYAQQALKQGVNDYLLKPINREALNEALSKMVGQIETEQKNHLAIHDFQREREEEVTKLRKVLVKDLLDSRSLFLNEELLAEKYYFHAQPGAYQAVAVKRDVAITEKVQTSGEFLFEKLKEILERELAKECNDFLFVSSGEYLFGILNFPIRNNENIRKAVRSSFNQILARKDFLGGAELTAGMGTLVKKAEELPMTFLAAKRAVEERLVEGVGRMLEIDSDGGSLFEKKLTGKFTRNLENALQTLNTEEIVNTVQAIYKEAVETPRVHGWEILELVCQCGCLFILRMDFSDKTELQKEFERNCDNYISTKELFGYLESFMVEKIDQLIAGRKEDSVRPVRLAKQYIHNHYQEQITLEEVSEHVGLTAAYFSVLFKKETEIGFAKYLMNERIEGAKELLRETSLSVGEICRKVGYNDLKHFTRLFEKSVGVKPAVYRKLYG